MCTSFLNCTKTVASTALKIHTHVPDPYDKKCGKLHYSILTTSEAIHLKPKIQLLSIQDLFLRFKMSKSAQSISVVSQIRTYCVFDISQPLGWEAALQTFQIFRFCYLRKRSKGAGVSHLFFLRSPRSADSGEHNIVSVALLEAEISIIMYTWYIYSICVVIVRPIYTYIK